MSTARKDPVPISDKEKEVIARMKKDLADVIEEYHQFRKENYSKPIYNITQARQDSDTFPCLTDMTFVRFYRGEKEDEKNGQKKLREYLKWRMETHADYVNTQTFEKEIKCNKLIIQDSYRDKMGRPVLYYVAHRHNKNDRDMRQVLDHIIHVLDSLVFKQSILNDERIVVIFELGQFTFQCMDYEVVKQFVDILQNHYCETLNYCLLIDAPFIFYACWAIIRPWLDPVVASKVEFAKRADLKDFIDVENPNSVPPEKDFQTKVTLNAA